MNSMLRGQNIYLRALEKKDATKLLLWENDPAHWKVSNTEVPFSMGQILEYIENSQQVRTHGQIRFMICLINSDEPIGTIDLFDVNFKHGHAGIGILIAEKEHRNQGLASEAVSLIVRYATDFLALRNLIASMHADNETSEKVFINNDFEFIGLKKDWLLFKGQRYDEKMYQLCIKE